MVGRVPCINGGGVHEPAEKNCESQTQLYGAIQIIRDTFLAYFRPPSSMCPLVTLAQTLPPAGDTVTNPPPLECHVLFEWPLMTSLRPPKFVRYNRGLS